MLECQSLWTREKFQINDLCEGYFISLVQNSPVLNKLGHSKRFYFIDTVLSLDFISPKSFKNQKYKFKMKITLYLPRNQKVRF